MRFSCPSPSIWQSMFSELCWTLIQLSAWEWHTHTNPHHPHLSFTSRPGPVWGLHSVQGSHTGLSPQWWQIWWHSGGYTDDTHEWWDGVFKKKICILFPFFCQVLVFLHCPCRGMQTFPKSSVLSVEVKAIFAWYFIGDLNYLLIWWNINNCALHSVTSLVTMIEKHTHKNQYRLSCYLVDFVSSSPGIIL